MEGQRPRCPSSTVRSIVIYNSFDLDNGQWLPLTINIGSWVLLQTRKRKRGGNEFIHSYKGRVKDFRLSNSGKTAKEVLIQHAYMHSELRLKASHAQLLPTNRPNYIYPSNIEDWQPVESIMGIFDAFHFSIGELQYNTTARRSLAERGVFFYDHKYIAPTDPQGFGALRPLPLPSLDSADWPLPSAETSESFRLKLHHEIKKCLRPNVASHQVKFTICMPLHVFVDFFHDEDVRKTKTMFICRSQNCMNFLDDGWGSNEVNGIISIVEKGSIVCKYMVASQNIIVSFYYMRWHSVNGRLVAIHQDLEDITQNPPMLLEIWCQEELITVLNVRTNVSLWQIRQDLENEVDANVPTNYLFECNGRKVPERKGGFFATNLLNIN